MPQNLPEVTDLNQPLPRVGVSIACWNGPQVLVVERAKPPFDGIWSLPGGSVEPGETTRAAALRELHEEAAVTAEISGLVDVLDVLRRDDAGTLQIHFVLAVFAGRFVSGKLAAGDDARRAMWIDPARLSDLPTTDRLAELVEKSRTLLG